MSRSSRSAERLVGALLLALPVLASVLRAEPASRRVVDLSSGWRTTLVADGTVGAQASTFDDSAWRTVDVPHNWDAYEGARQTRHGNLHGSAWYRRSFDLEPEALAGDRRTFLHFEGVGSYATVWVNGIEVGRHAGGLTIFTLDVTDAVRARSSHTLVVRADHPAGIRDLPWVCGGCELVYGFSEGPQPFGIFRPVSLYTTAPVRVEPFGIHVWNDTAAEPVVHTRTEVRNTTAAPRAVTLALRFRDADGATVLESHHVVTLPPTAVTTVESSPVIIPGARLWSPDSPHLYTLTAEVLDGDTVLDRDQTSFGIRTVTWPDPNGPEGRPLLINGKPVFLNGTCDYEHNLGANHAFSTAQIEARAAQIRAGGFNAFRDAHHPHNLRFNAIWDRSGTLWWTQMGAQIWFDRDDFRTNFRTLLREWVKERRNSPSLILWGLQNESKLPTAFAEECAAIIRAMDPTASTQRLITTCNGGTGTEWNVPQNWTGTYGGDPFAYADDLRRQRLIGEYGGWRSLGLHSEMPRDALPLPDLPLSEERFCALMETKIRLADSVRGESIGHFQWPFTTHANPGRNFGENGEQLHDGVRPLDRVGPANNKGLFTLWGEPTDAYHLYRSNHTDAGTHPMVAIMSRTWPDRWTGTGKKSGIVVYSNCEDVELFNDLGGRSLGVRTRNGRGTHFRWDGVQIETNYLRAEGRVGGQVVATDAILLHHLPHAPRYGAADAAEPDILAAEPGWTYVARINCGGPEFTDSGGRIWTSDTSVATSWAADYTNLPPEFASRRRLYEPIVGTRDDAVFQAYRYGRDRLKFRIAVEPGTYAVDLFFAEPWYLAGGGAECTGWRRFDVAVNGTTVLRDLDIWKETGGHARALRKTVSATAHDGAITLSFPRVEAGQAVISAIALRTRSTRSHGALPAQGESVTIIRRTHLDLGDPVYAGGGATLTALPSDLLEAELVSVETGAAARLAPAPVRFDVAAESDVYVAHDARIQPKPDWLAAWSPTGLVARTTENAEPGFELYRRRVAAGAGVELGPNLRSGPRSDPAAMYFGIVQKVRPLPPAQWIAAYSGDADKLAGHCRIGQPVHASGDVRFASMPNTLNDADWIRRAPAADPAATITLGVAIHAEIVVAFDERVTVRPAWTQDWIATTQTLRTTAASGARHALLRQRLAPGASVTLGGDGTLPDGGAAEPYVVFVRPVRPSATFAGERQDATAVIWPITVAVGDRYGLNFRYRARIPAAASYTIIASDGATVCTGELTLAPVASDAWSVARIRTCASLNAGTYVLHVDLPPDASGTVFDTVEVE
ncbi:MAG: DUF4982 domain-containing protein [Opitutaceae bacterium]|nr:DUF4982 domain-containing protein [Opitutaceae bacterium]